MVRAKFKVDSINRSLTSKPVRNPDGSQKKNDAGAFMYEPAELQTVIMTPVYSSDPTSENAKFWAASPSGRLELGCVNEEAGKYFELGNEYYIDFTKAE